MADEKVSVLIDIQIEADEAVKRQQELKLALKASKENLDELKKTSGEMSAEYIKQEAEIATLNQQLRNNATVLKQVASDTSEVSGAYAALNKKAAEAKQIAKDMATAYGAQDERTKSAIATANEYTNQLKETDKELGDGHRFIGLYTDALDGFRDKLAMFPTSFSQMKDGLKGVATGFMGLIKQMWLMVANPIGAVIAAVALALFGLYSVFKDFKPVVDLVERSLAAVGAAFEVVKNVIIGVFTGQKSLTESTKGLAKSMGEAAGAAYALKKAQQELEDSQASLEVQNKRAETQMQKLLLQSKNRTISEKERIKLIDDAMKIETDIFNRKKAQNDEEVRIAEQKIITGKDLTAKEIARLKTEGVAYARTIQDKKSISDEEIDALKTALLSREDINQQSISLQEKSQNRRDTLADAAIAKEEKRQEKIQAANAKAQAAKEKAEAEKQKAIEDEKKLIKQADDLYEQSLLNRQKFLEKELELKKAAALKSIELLESALQAENENNEKSIEQTKEYLTTLADAKLAIQESQAQNEFDFQSAQLKKKYDADIANAKAIRASTAQITQAYNIAQDKIDEERNKNKVAVAANLAGGLAELFGKETALGKAAASAQVAIQTYQGAMSAWTAAQVFPAPLNAIVGAASVAATVALGAKSIKDIWAVKAAGIPNTGSGGGNTPSMQVPTGSQAAITGGLVSRGSGQVQQTANTQAMDQAIKNNPMQPVLVTNDLTTAINQKVQLKSDNSL